MALDATVKGASSNAYLTAAEATAYLNDNRLYDELWIAASIDTRERAIIWATALLDGFFDWNGARRTLEQALRWPRVGVLDADGDFVDYDTIPQLIKNATADLALELLRKDRTRSPGVLGTGLSEIKVGSIALKVDKFQEQNLIPRTIAVMLEPFGSLDPSGVVGDRVMKVIRT